MRFGLLEEKIKSLIDSVRETDKILEKAEVLISDLRNYLSSIMSEADVNISPIEIPFGNAKMIIETERVRFNIEESLHHKITRRSSPISFSILKEFINNLEEICQKINEIIEENNSENRKIAEELEKMERILHPFIIAKKLKSQG